MRSLSDKGRNVISGQGEKLSQAPRENATTKRRRSETLKRGVKGGLRQKEAGIMF